VPYARILTPCWVHTEAIRPRVWRRSIMEHDT
jgi:hypothetical protein